MVEIRSAEVRDAAVIAALLEELGYPAAEDAVAERLRRMSRDPHIAVAVAEDNGTIVGVATLHVFAVLHEDKPRGQLTALVVTVRARGQGIGSALVRHLERSAASQGIGRLVVTTANHRTGTHEFYARLGYEWTGRRYAKRLDSGPPASHATGETAR